MGFAPVFYKRMDLMLLEMGFVNYIYLLKINHL